MDLLDAAVRSYAWGSHAALADLQGRPSPTAEPEAELWMGAHPSAPSGVTRGAAETDLCRVVDADPAAELGADVAARFDGRLPFLLKVLAAQKALSIQVHPDRATARDRYRAETDAGLAAADRNYQDDWPKPEVLCALTDFEALAGLREPAEAAAVLATLQVADLEPVVRRLQEGDDGRLDALRMILSWPEPVRDDLLARVVDAAAARAADPVHGAAFAALGRIAEDHPGDLGIVASLLLNHVVLAPGEALFMAAGGLHAYLSGTGVELLANSDNVLRAGLTSKRIDVDELCRISDPRVEVPLLRPEADADGVAVYDPGVPEFRLFRVEATGDLRLPGAGPRIVLVVDGSCVLTRGDETLTLAPGRSAFVPAADGDVDARLDGLVFVAAAGA